MSIKFKIPSLDNIVWAAVSIAAIVATFLLVWVFKPTRIIVDNHHEQLVSGTSMLTGQPCGQANRRPIAVMIASDPEARPLSGLSAADVVLEMPVTPNGITRMMGIFQCGPDPKEIGSIRSARQDFIPLAMGFQAILAHWGGEQAALEHLNNGVMDNIDALAYEGTVFYRKRGIPKPHNGFTTLELLREKAQDLDYVASTSMTTWLHQDKRPDRNLGGTVDTVTMPWPQGMGVEFKYDADSNTYLRWRGGTEEKDATTGQQVRAAVVVVMSTESSFIRDQYISVRTTGGGVATVYQNGGRVPALWKKTSPNDMLVFTDGQGKPIPLARGTVWVLIDAPLPNVP